MPSCYDPNGPSYSTNIIDVRAYKKRATLQDVIDAIRRIKAGDQGLLREFAFIASEEQLSAIPVLEERVRLMRESPEVFKDELAEDEKKLRSLKGLIDLNDFDIRAIESLSYREATVLEETFGSYRVDEDTNKPLPADFLSYRTAIHDAVIKTVSYFSTV